MSSRKIKDIVKKALSSDSSPHTLALSCAIGFFIACFPIPGTHSLLMLACKYLFNLNFPLLFLTTSINNPWTMIPFFTCEYLFGYWLVHSIMEWNPNWHISLEKIFGSGTICLWSFFIGGTIIGIIASLLSYPLIHWLLTRSKSNQRAIAHLIKN